MYLVGTAHFSKESCEDVATVIQVLRFWFPILALNYDWFSTFPTYVNMGWTNVLYVKFGYLRRCESKSDSACQQTAVSVKRLQCHHAALVCYNLEQFTPVVNQETFYSMIVINFQQLSSSRQSSLTLWWWSCAKAGQISWYVSSSSVSCVCSAHLERLGAFSTVPCV